MERRQEGTGSLPHHEAGGDADVERVFRAVLRNFQGAVAGIDDTLLHALDLVAEDEGILLARLETVGAEFVGVLHLFHGEDDIALAAQARDGIEGVGEVLPTNGILSPKCRLVNLGGGRGGGDAAHIDCLKGKGIGTAEDAADIVEGTHIVQHDHKGRLLHLPERRKVGTLHLFYCPLSHGHVVVCLTQIILVIIPSMNAHKCFMK